MDGLELGAVIAGRFRVDRLIAEGGMCRVYAAQHTLTRKHLALKVLRRAHAANPSMRRRFLREARAACAVRHRNVLEIDDVIELADSTLVLVMDRLEGESLAKKLFRRGRLPLAELAPIAIQVIDAVSAAHAVGIVHRDLKPENIFVGPGAGGVPSVKVIDFGIAKLTASNGDAERTDPETRRGDMLGTPYYMAPEQVVGDVAVDHRADIWAIGVILYEGLSGTRPVDGETVPQILLRTARGTIVPLEQRVSGLPIRLVKLVGRMLRRDRDERPSSLRELRLVLRECATRVAAVDRATSSRGASQRPVAMSVAPRSSGPVWWTSAMAATAVLAIALVATRTPRGSATAPPAMVTAGLLGAGLARDTVETTRPRSIAAAPAEVAPRPLAIPTGAPVAIPAVTPLSIPAAIVAPLPPPSSIGAAPSATTRPPASKKLEIDRENPWGTADAPPAP
jgi:serine/threonine-protein kinase